MEIELATTIAFVTVYADRALIERQGHAAIEAAGEHMLRIGGLPLALQRDSLRAAGRGPAGTRILGIEQQNEVHPAAPEEKLQALRDEIERLQRALTLLADRQQLLDDQRAWLRTLGEQTARSLARGTAAGTSKPEDAAALFTYTAAEAERLATARTDLERERADLQRELEAHQRELAGLGGAGRPDRVAALVRVAVAEAGPVELQLSYVVPGASWRPRYDARVEQSAGRVHLTQQALARQATGEDWAGVGLALSTAKPAAAVALPKEPPPWYVDVLAPPPSPQPKVAAAPVMRRMRQSFALGAAASSVDMDAMVMEAAAPAEFALEEASVERSGVAQIYRVSGTVDVPSDGQFHTLGLADDDLPCRFDYIATPVVAPGAHLHAQADNTTGRVLLPGELHVFHPGPGGDEYVGATTLELTAEGAPIDLYLGVDDNLSVKSELIERETEKGNLLQSGIRRITYGYRVTLANRTGATQRVVLKDRLPVPRNERIKLRVLDLKPAPTNRTRLEQLAWDLTLADGEERRIEWRFVVEAPADLELSGLA
ncbi:MAG TPA: mucoidy inhibitor MuiA family protein [Ktedonobacterales bacterium]|nr:mucoidy inhibitor MuiA family protein [Ktedonobacterales bacterium]